MEQRRRPFMPSFGIENWYVKDWPRCYAYIAVSLSEDIYFRQMRFESRWTML